jgi:hypothetical protein
MLECTVNQWARIFQSNAFVRAGNKWAYLKPSFLYPAALQYQLDSGVMKFFSHGRFTMKLVKDGADMLGSRGLSDVKLAVRTL